MKFSRCKHTLLQHDAQKCYDARRPPPTVRIVYAMKIDRAALPGRCALKERSGSCTKRYESSAERVGSLPSTRSSERKRKTRGRRDLSSLISGLDNDIAGLVIAAEGGTSSSSLCLSTLAIDGLMRVHCVWQVIFAVAGPASACCRECRAFDQTRTRSVFLPAASYLVLRGRGREGDGHEVGGVRDRDRASGR